MPWGRRLRLGRLQWGCADVGTAQWHHLAASPRAQNGWFSYRKWTNLRRSNPPVDAMACPGLPCPEAGPGHGRAVGAEGCSGGTRIGVHLIGPILLRHLRPRIVGFPIGNEQI